MRVTAINSAKTKPRLTLLQPGRSGMLRVEEKLTLKTPA